ncbi:MAG: dehydrogenase, partial [Chitinophagaceae bacterium]
MQVRSKVPLRLGLAGGGTDVSPYCDMYGGCILNATIDLFAYCTLCPTSNGKISFTALDRNEFFESDVVDQIPTDGVLDLHKGVYNRVISEFKISPFSFDLKTHSDAPSGSGLGSSSTMVVAILQSFVEYLNLPLGEYDIAQLAYSIEREDLKLSGGKQDQYAATFGGFNFMEFYAENRVIVNPLRIREQHIEELEAS